MVFSCCLGQRNCLLGGNLHYCIYLFAQREMEAKNYFITSFRSFDFKFQMLKCATQGCRVMLYGWLQKKHPLGSGCFYTEID
jgi:hypothetical protein